MESPKTFDNKNIEITNTAKETTTMTTAEFNTSINSIVSQAEGVGSVSEFSNIEIDMSDLFEKVTDDTYSFITATLLLQLRSDWSSLGSTYLKLDSTSANSFSGMDVHFNNGTDISGSGSVDEIHCHH